MLERIIVVNDVATARGGATGLALLSVRLLREAGFPVTLIVGDEGNNPALAAAGVDVVALGGRRIGEGGGLAGAARGLHNASARRLLAAWIAQNDRPGFVYHVHGWSKILSPAIFHALAPVARRTVLHAHDFFLACPNGAFQDFQREEPCARVPLGLDCLTTNCDKRSYSQKLWRAARGEALSVALGRAFDDTPVLLIHDRMRSYFERSGFAARRLAVLRNPVEPFTRERIRAEANDAFYFVGRIEAEKGVGDAAAAAASAGVRLRMIGDGPDRAAVEAAHPDLEILGWRSREDVGSLVRDARALVMPSRYPEPFGLVAAEASRSGLPVILSKHAFLADEFVAEGLGVSCDTRDHAALAGAMRRLADAPANEIRALSERAFSARAPIATTPAGWRDRLIELYEARLADVPPARAVAASALAGEAPLTPLRARLFNVKFSPNLGDGLLSEALEDGLREMGCDGRNTYSVDMAAREGYGPGSASRSAVLKALNGLPPALRQAAVRMPLEIMMRRRWRPHYLARLQGAQAVVVGGGNLFTDIDLNFPSKIAAVLELAAGRGLPSAVYGVGVSGNWSRTGLRIVRQALRRSQPCYVSVRDAFSKENFDTLFAEAAGRRAEIVRDPGLLVSRYAGTLERPGEAAIGLCVTSAIALRYHSSSDVSEAGLADWYAALCARLQGENRPIIAFTNGSPEDELFLDTIHKRLEAASGPAYARRRVATPAALAALVSGLGALVAHRMHALIAGYAFAVPIYALRWDRKVDAFMASVGAAEHMAVAAPGTADKVAAGIADLLRRPQSFDEGERRERVLGEALSDVEHLFEALRNAVAERSPDGSAGAAPSGSGAGNRAHPLRT